MCWIFINHFSCGHEIPDAKRNVLHRCDAVSAALVFYHDQPAYLPLDQPLRLPNSCQSMPPFNHTTPDFVRNRIYTPQQRWNEWMVYQFEINGFNFQHRERLMHQALGPVSEPLAHVSQPYPLEQIRMYHAFQKYHDRPIKAPNVSYVRVNYPCGRGTEQKCLRYHQQAVRMPLPTANDTTNDASNPDLDPTSAPMGSPRPNIGTETRASSVPLTGTSAIETTLSQSSEASRSTDLTST